MGTAVGERGRAGDHPAPVPPWLWLYGPPGVGKSASGFEVFSRLVSRGHRVGFIELDQVGMCMPAPTESRSAATADILPAMLANLARAGAEAVVVSGDIAGPPMDDVLARVPTRPVLCRLRADHEVIIQRLTTRRSLQYAEGSLAYERDAGAPAGDLSVTTHPLGVADVADEILGRLGPWPPTSQTSDTDPEGPLALVDAETVLVTGPRAVGKSTVAWQLYMRSVAAGVVSGYLDLEQMGWLRPPTGAGLLPVQLANVSACWSGFRRQGATRLVLCGTVSSASELEAYRALVPSLRTVALTAGYDALLQRALSRSHHKEIWLPGDDLFGRPDSELPPLAERGATFTGQGADVVMDTDHLGATDAAALITFW